MLATSPGIHKAIVKASEDIARKNKLVAELHQSPLRQRAPTTSLPATPANATPAGTVEQPPPPPQQQHPGNPHRTRPMLSAGWNASPAPAAQPTSRAHWQPSTAHIDPQPTQRSIPTPALCYEFAAPGDAALPQPRQTNRAEYRPGAAHLVEQPTSAQIAAAGECQLIGEGFYAGYSKQRDAQHIKQPGVMPGLALTYVKHLNAENINEQQFWDIDRATLTAEDARGTLTRLHMAPGVFHNGAEYTKALAEVLERSNSLPALVANDIAGLVVLYDSWKAAQQAIAAREPWIPTEENEGGCTVTPTVTKAYHERVGKHLVVTAWRALDQLRTSIGEMLIRANNLSPAEADKLRTARLTKSTVAATKRNAIPFDFTEHLHPLQRERANPPGSSGTPGNGGAPRSRGRSRGRNNNRGNNNPQQVSQAPAQAPAAAAASSGRGSGGAQR